ncbi:MAG TPA: plastocyanin/azurin family copper-binding protein, partial [Nitriliruptorales bacterium]
MTPSIAARAPEARTLRSALVVAVSALVWLVAVPGVAEEAAAPEVGITGDAFDPGEVRVTAGTTVRWRVHDLGPHDVIAVDGTFASGRLVTGLTFEHTFDEPGSYPYYCSLHAACDDEGCRGQVGTIVVEAPARPPTEPGPRTANAAPAEPAAPAPEPTHEAPAEAPPPAPAPRYAAPPGDHGGWWTVTAPLIEGQEVPAPLVAPPRADLGSRRPAVPLAWQPSASLSGRPAPGRESLAAIVARWLLLTAIVTTAARARQRRVTLGI